jgi:hypothetical protein
LKGPGAASFARRPRLFIALRNKRLRNILQKYLAMSEKVSTFAPAFKEKMAG